MLLPHLGIQRHDRVGDAEHQQCHRQWNVHQQPAVQPMVQPLLVGQLPSIAAEFLDEVRRNDRALVELHVRINDGVKAARTSVTDVFGVGSIVACYLIGYSGDVRRFPSAGHYARYNATAPIEASSGPTKRHRLNPNGNMTLGNSFESVEEVAMPPGWVPSYPLGTTHPEFAEQHGLPFGATRGGKESLYPEYQAKIQQMMKDEAAKKGAK